MVYKKKEFAKILARKHGYTFQDAETVLAEFCDTAEGILREGNGFALRGFGTFSVVRRGRRRSVCPRTRALIEIPEMAAPKFTPGKRLRRCVREGASKHAEKR